MSESEIVEEGLEIADDSIDSPEIDETQEGTGKRRGRRSKEDMFLFQTTHYEVLRDEYSISVREKGKANNVKYFGDIKQALEKLVVLEACKEDVNSIASLITALDTAKKDVVSSYNQLISE